MKSVSAISVLGVLASAGALSSETSSGLSPVTRVVELLKSLSKQVEKDEKTEEDLYETFVCWAKSVISQKTKDNAAAEARTRTLSTYLDDLNSGRIELTTERVDLTKQLEEINAAIEVARQMREQDNKDFLGAEDEMQKAIVALTDAIEVLKAATKDHKKGVLLSMNSNLNSGFEVRQQQAAALGRAVELSEHVLTTGDAVFLRRLLTGEVPKADWKKLNRKATFKMDYKARSFKIQDVLAKLLETFDTDLKAAQKKEADAVALNAKLMESKHKEKDECENALSRMDTENGAVGLSREQTESELASLKEQVANDNKYIKQVEETAAEKKVEWKARKELRAGEISAISKAVSILHSDDARDTFSASFKSQSEGNLLQLAVSSSVAQGRSAKAVEVLRAAASGRDSRLTALAIRTEHAEGHFDEVVSAIDRMLEDLQKEENEDLAKKEQCEANRVADTEEAIAHGRNMDDMSDRIQQALTRISELTEQREEETTRRTTCVQEQREMSDIRNSDHKDWQQSKRDDEAARALVLQASDVLHKFYSDNGLMLVQKGNAGKSPVQTQAGEAPPPPPSTWEAPYGGKVDEQEGIFAILEMIADDIAKDLEKARAEEEKENTDFRKAMNDLIEEENSLTLCITDLNTTIAELEKSVQETKEARLSKQGELASVMKRIKDAEPGCDYFVVNYPLRVENRHNEIDGLNKAKIILSGGSFTPTKDPNREWVPGDALLQRRSKFLGRQVSL